MRRPTLLALALAAALALTGGAAAQAASIADAPVKTVKAGQGRIGYRAVGKGSPVVLVMGLSGTMDAWTPSFVDALAASGHRVITFDNEGIGRTTLGKGRLTIARMADDTNSLIHALGYKRADVLGWSMGGMIAQALALEHPRSVRRLVLCATAPGNGKATAPAPDVLRELLSGGGNAASLLGLLFPPGQDAATAAFATEILKYKNARTSAPPAITSAQLSATSSWMIGGDPASASPAKIKQRVLVGGGALDQLLPIANQRYIAKTAPHATLREYADAAHGFLFQDQAQFLPEVAGFLNKK